MKEKELRIALVCFGGVSLAVYMHGVSSEILKLVRASKALHAITDGAERLTSRFSAADRANGDCDTETVYYELLRELGTRVDLRVIVDIVAGASAGGINSSMLARALSHDLSMSPLRDLWLDKADVSELLAREARAGRWSKLILRPVIWLLKRMGSTKLAQDAEAWAKLSLLLRSRWFKPPLDGLRMAGLMYEGAASMGTAASPQASLLPVGQRLDLFVSLTDFYGRQQSIPIHDPPIIHDREHRLVLHFSYRQTVSGSIESDFSLADVPALAFAARATSSFPGAFPPAQIPEIDQLLRSRSLTWPRRAAFIDRHFAHYARINVDPTSVSFIDGGVLNNRPFREAIMAIQGRPAYRQVDRRLIYVDPDPAPAAGSFHQGTPGFFATLKGALSDIPRVEPITQELDWVAQYNKQVRRVRDLIEGARPRISQFVADIMSPDQAAINAERLRAWRALATSKAFHDAGFAYEGYLRLKLASVRAFLSRLLTALRGVGPESPFALAIAAVVEAWAEQSGMVFQAAGEANAPRLLQFLSEFDMDYRRRRLHFLIEGQNRLYQLHDQGLFNGSRMLAVGELKRTLYERLEALHSRERRAYFSPQAHERMEALFPMAPSPEALKDVAQYARRVVERRREDIDALLSGLAAEMAMKADTAQLDEILAHRQSEGSGPSRALLADYVGFPFWDVLTFPVMTWREAGEFNEIRIDRISPNDAHSFQGSPAARELKGVDLGHFAGLLSRAYRENDYLLGRLHALDRLIDIVCNAADVDAASADITRLKKHGFLRILDAEEAHLSRSSKLIAELRHWLAS